MKKSLMVLFMYIFFLATPSFAGNGSAILPHWLIYLYEEHIITSSIYLSNISDSDATVNVILYDQDGYIVQDDGDDSAGKIRVTNYVGSYDDNFAGGTVTFTLAGNQTTHIQICPDTINLMKGYGVIKWSNTTENVVSLVAVGVNNGVQTETGTKCKARYNIDINNSMPF